MKKLNVAILGCGTVGGGPVEYESTLMAKRALAERAAFSEQRCTDRDRAEAIALLENQKRAYAASLPLWKRTILWLRQP